MRFVSEADLQGLVSGRIAEAASLEYKRELHVETRGERLEVLKDLTGLANGGGGTILYGIEEKENGDWPAASAIVPVADSSAVGRLEDIVRAGVHPPLLVEYSPIGVDGGFVLAVDVQPSPLGPCMVESYGERRYFLRVGTRTAPMTEQQVRDAYALASRGRDRRPDLWAMHGLPLAPPTDGPWLVVSALPEEPLSDVLDMRMTSLSDLIPPPEMATYINNQALGDLTPALTSLARWVDGYHALDLPAGDNAPGHVVRLYRDGAAALATRVRWDEEQTLSTVHIARLLNTALLYLGWLWTSLGLARPVEIRTSLHNVLDRTFDEAQARPSGPIPRPIAGPAGLQLDPVSSSLYVLPWEIRRASVRHRSVMAFADRLQQATGEPQAEVPFRRGLLHDRSGSCLSVSVGGDTIWDDAGGGHIGWVHLDSSITATRTGEVVGWYAEGVVTDMSGDAVAVLELAPGAACPDDFIGTSLAADPGGSSRTYTTKIRASGHDIVQPAHSGRWSATGLRDLFE